MEPSSGQHKKPSSAERHILESQLGIDVQSVHDVEQSVVSLANKQLASLQKERDQRKLSKLESKINLIYDKINQLDSQLEVATVSQGGPLRRKLRSLHEQLDPLLDESESIRASATDQATSQRSSSDNADYTGTEQLHSGNHKDWLVQRGIITPFPTEGLVRSSTLPPPSSSTAPSTDSPSPSNSDVSESDGADSSPAATSTITHYSAVLDDGLETNYLDRVLKWARARYQARTKCSRDQIPPDLDPQREMWETHDSDFQVAPGVNVPAALHSHLFQYQVTCLKWLWELYSSRVGGVLADEMGLGKTIQSVAFLASLVYSKKLGPRKPILIVCPATVMNQWVKEFHQWWPPMRVVILHSSGAGFKSAPDLDKPSPSKRKRQVYDDEDDDGGWDELYDVERTKQRPSQQWVRQLLNKVTELGHVVITTYGSLRSYSTDILPVNWGYVVLDEGHKIRNSDAEITLLCKQLRTPHRLILSGTPVQNSLAELWSIFDFVYPGRLGTLPVFQTEFAVPINIGGYANASTVQVQTAYRCACVLRDMIQPYMLRRVKADVAKDLPTKSEQVLFCKLTPIQRVHYKRFLESHETDIILQGKLNSLFGIDALRKICNHPCLHSKDIPPDVDASGKLVVVRELLKLWSREGHRALLFCQTRQMLNVVELMVCHLELNYRRMDGATLVKRRARLVDEFNNDPAVFVFLLTTKVGGLGVNLTGANRLIIFDPDWNPATDSQARERAWRIGQSRHVTIYRLVTTGTIEEKIYHRQIFKQHLSSKVLTDPKQRRYFKLHDLRDLFTLAEDDQPLEETINLMKEYEMGRKEKRDEDLVEQLEGVARLENFIPNDATNQEMPAFSTHPSSSSSRPSEQPTGTEDAVLSTLLKSASVNVAIQHDTVMQSSRPEMIIVEREAQRVADGAIAALRASRLTRSGQPVSVPTWTGRSGSVAGRKFGPSSSESRVVPSSVLLQNIRQQRGQEEEQGAESGVSSSSFSSMEPMALIVSIRDYIAEQGGTATSQEIVRQFRLRLTADEVGLFRKMLQGIATFQQQASGGFWCLKNEFRD